MQLIIVTGLSGGGKSIAIRQLEDSGFYCIDNLPAEFLLPIAENLEKNAKLTLTFESFGYKRGLPYASDLVFDVRCLPNPYYSPELRPLTGLDAPVASYLAQEPLVSEMIDDIAAFIAKWLPHYRGQNRHYLTICIGCTGGQHRSVYVAEMLGRRFADQAGTIVRHRALSANLLPENKLQTL